MPRGPEDIPDAVLRMALAADAGPAFHHAAFERFGSWEAAAAASERELRELDRVPAARAAAVHAQLCAVDPDAERRAMERIGARALVLGDPDYPGLLAPVPTPPILLWVRGSVEAAHDDSVAVVGARRATPYGLGQAARFAGAFATAGVTVVSGGARGVDAEAHRAALRAGGATVAVLGCGLAEPYPPEHVPLFESIVSSGGLLVSEFPVGWPPIASNFPRRNRIISGLSRTVLVVEAGATSGALITARHAIDDHQREPCAVPGPVDSARSDGCNRAIRDGWAHVALEPDDVLSLLGRREGKGSPASGVPGAPASEALEVPAALREHVERAALILARRPRTTDGDLSEALGVDAATACRVRTFASLRSGPAA